MSLRILTADWHLTDDPYDEYRWGLFPWLRTKIREAIGDAYPHKSATLYILGDLTDKKDRHSQVLVNRVVDELVGLYRQTGLQGITILGANHDGLDQPYFKFLRHFPFIQYITEPQVITEGMKRIAMLPYTKTPMEDWKGIDFSKVHYVMAHITVTGAKSETDFELEGVKGGEFLTNLRIGKITGQARVFSGDVHVPQRVGAVEYVGAPYPVRFGDKFRGRVLALGRGGREEWHFPTIRKAKLAVTSVAGLARGWLRKGDQLRVELSLPKSERHDWHRHREEIQQWCERKGVVLRGVELRADAERKLRLVRREQESQQTTPSLWPSQALTTYVKRTKAEPEVAERGHGLLKHAHRTIQEGQ
jgi:hypothetical protein